MTRSAAVDAQLQGYLPAVAGPAIAALCLATAGLGMVLTPPTVPAAWRTAGAVLVAFAAAWLSFVLWRRMRARRHLVRASRLLKLAPALTMRVSVTPDARRAAFADLVPVKKGQDALVTRWPASPEDAVKSHPDKPARRIPVLKPPKGFVPSDRKSMQADVLVDPADPTLVVIRTRRGCLVSVAG